MLNVISGVFSEGYVAPTTIANFLVVAGGGGSGNAAAGLYDGGGGGAGGYRCSVSGESSGGGGSAESPFTYALSTNYTCLLYTSPSPRDS